MLSIYGASLSTPANKVLMCANKLNLDFEYIEVDLSKAEHKTDKFAKLLPSGKIPAIDDGGFILWESKAINKYLCKKHPSDLYPENIEKQALVDQWIDFVSAHLATAYGRVLFNKVFAPKAGMPVDKQSLSDGQTFIARYLPIIEKRLEQSNYLVGNTITIADINLLSTIDPSEVINFDLKPFPKLTILREQLRAQPFYQKVHAKYGEALLKATA